MLRFHIPKPRSSDGTLLPSVLTAALAGMLVLQLDLVRSGDADPAGVAASPHAQSAVVPPIALMAADGVIRERPIFTPARVSGSGSSPGDALGGARVAGAWAVGRQLNVVLRQQDGETRNLRVGQTVNQWVLASVTPSGARFMRDGKTITVPFGSTAPPSAADAPEKEEDDQ